MVTGATSGEGKTFVSVNLAASIAMTSTAMPCWWTVTFEILPSQMVWVAGW